MKKEVVITKHRRYSTFVEAIDKPCCASLMAIDASLERRKRKKSIQSTPTTRLQGAMLPLLLPPLLLLRADGFSKILFAC